jgi:large exoprotein involved in heme utilization and adhesion
MSSRLAIIIAFDDSDILARSDDARGGNITLGPFFSDAPPIGAISPTEGNSRVDVSAAGRLSDGNITIPNINFIENSLTNLQDTIVDTAALTTGSCIARAEASQATFVDTGSGGLPNRPGDAAISAYPTGNVQAPSNAEPQAVWQPGDPIVEPSGAFSLPDGRLVLARRCDNN